MLLNQDPTENTSYLEDHPTSALFAAAQNGHTDCIKLLLTSGVSADVLDENGFTPLHFAAAHGHHRCVGALVARGADVDRGAAGGQTPLFVASGAGRPECVRALLDVGADRSRTTTDSCTALHAAVSSGHVNTLQLLLCHPGPDHAHNPDPNHDPNHDHNHHPNHEPDSCFLVLSSSLLNQANSEGWTAAHMAAARGFKDCLEVLCSHSEQDIERRDRWNRTIHDLATDDCKDLLENLDSYRVSVCVQLSRDGEPMCPVEVLGEELCVSWLGCVRVHRGMHWAELGHALDHTLTSHLQLVCGDTGLHTHPQGREDGHAHLGLTPASIASVHIGDTVWLPGQELSPSPWDLVRKPFCQCITIRLKGLSELSLDELALESLIPLQLLQNYVRLVEQYRNVIFHGLEGSCQEYLANQVSRCIKHKQEAVGVGCDIIRVEVDESLSKEQLLETFINCGFLVPVSGVCSGRCVVVLLEGLEKAQSLSQLLGDLCEGLENRGMAYPLTQLHGQAGLHHFRECGFLIGMLSKPRLQGSELRLQQHFRWVTLRWDCEPLHGLLGRHLRRKLLHKTQGQSWAAGGLMERTVCWVSQVWQQLNACLSRLGTHEALLGPQLFLSCPVVPDNTQPIVKWLARLWNMVVVPRVEEAIVSRVMVKCLSPQRPSPSKQRLSPGQQAVVKAALSILVNKCVLQGCPLPRHEIDRHLMEFRGGTFPMSAIGSCKGSRKGRDSGLWRRANTSPRKKGSPASNWSSTGSLREGSLSNTDVRFITNGDGQRVVDDTVSVSLCSEEENDLIRELQTMCSSKSEPDISKISQSKDDFLVFSDSPSAQSPDSPHKTDHETTAQIQPHTTGSCHSNRSPAHTAQSNERRSAPRPKSQLPIPSSRGQPQPRASSSSSSSVATNRPQTTANRNTTATKSQLSSKARQAPPTNDYNVNKNNQPQEDVWILHRDLHENINNNK